MVESTPCNSAPPFRNPGMIRFPCKQQTLWFPIVSTMVGAAISGVRHHPRSVCQSVSGSEQVLAPFFASDVGRWLGARSCSRQIACLRRGRGDPRGPKTRKRARARRDNHLFKVVFLVGKTGPREKQMIFQMHGLVVWGFDPWFLERLEVWIGGLGV